MTYELTAPQTETYRKYAQLNLPRHTSYPIVPAWRGDVTAADVESALEDIGQSKTPLSLYFHVPYCKRLCYYCGCTREIVDLETVPQSKDPRSAYLAALQLEAQKVLKSVPNNPVQQVHLGGGSPTYLSPPQLEQMWNNCIAPFNVADDAEIAIEVDPRVTTADHVRTLRKLGFNRVSLGVQDFDAKVQESVNRIQSFEMVEDFVKLLRGEGFDSINFDLIYGLPYQTLTSMKRTLDQVMELSPDRVAFYRLAVIPDMFKWQRVFQRTDLPEGDLPLELNLLAINRFISEGYEFIGLDHFAKKTEELSTALNDGSLRRNFQGMSTGQELQIVAMGPSAVSQLDGLMVQNVKGSKDWMQKILADGNAVSGGTHLDADDKLRRELLQQLYSYGQIDIDSLEKGHAISFDSYFAAEQDALKELQAEGMVQRSEDGRKVELTPQLGRLLVRVVASVFDKYLPPKAYREGMSQGSKVG